jgi:hypothetical protein
MLDQYLNIICKNRIYISKGWLVYVADKPIWTTKHLEEKKFINTQKSKNSDLHRPQW